MRDRLALFLIAVIVIGIAASLWLWRTDAVLVHKCRAAGGTWQATARTCAVTANRFPASRAFPHR